MLSKNVKALENSIIKKLSNVHSGNSLITKSFVKAHLDHGNLIYKEPNNEIFCQNWEYSI